MGTTYHLQKFDRVFVVPETTYGTLTEYDDGDEIRVLGGSIEYSQERIPVEDNDQFRDVSEMLDMRQTVSFSLQAYLRLSGTGNVVPECDEILSVFFDSVTNNANDTACTAIEPIGETEIAVTGGTGVNYSAGDSVEIAGILYMVTGSGADKIDVTPGLLVATAVGTAVRGAQNYKLRQFPDGSFSLYVVGNNDLMGVSGCFVDKISISGAGNDRIKIDITGRGKTLGVRAGSTTLSGGINDAVGSLTVATGTGDYATIGSLLFIDEGLATEELIKITNIVGTTWTITRNYGGYDAAASAHLDGAVISPFRPPRTITGEILTGVVGDVHISGVKYYAQSWSLEIDAGNTIHDEDYGTASASGYAAGGKLSVVPNLSFIMNRTNYRHFVNGVSGTSHALHIQAGGSVPDICAFYVPAVIPTNPTRPVFGGDGFLMVELTGRAISTTEGGSVYFMVA
jgi:hypothetical protein